MTGFSQRTGSSTRLVMAKSPKEQGVVRASLCLSHPKTEVYPWWCTRHTHGGIPWVVYIGYYTPGRLPREVYLGMYTREATQGGIPYYTPPYVHPYTPPGYVHHLHTLGTPTIVYCTRVYLYLCTPVSRCRTAEPWAQGERNPWVRASQEPQDPKSVRGW